MRLPSHPFFHRSLHSSSSISPADDHLSPYPFGTFRIFPPSIPSSPRLDPSPPPTYDTSCLTPPTIPTPHVDEKSEVSVVVLLREDYRATLIYAREFEWRVATRKAVRRHMYSQSPSQYPARGFEVDCVDLLFAEWYLILILVITLGVLLEQVIRYCHPLTRRIQKWPAGFMIPIVILVILSFPPLVGHESKCWFRILL